MTGPTVYEIVRGAILEQLVTQRDVCKGFGDAARRNAGEAKAPALARRLMREAEYWDWQARMYDATWRRLRTSWQVL
jgi:hypothetical protein